MASSAGTGRERFPGNREYPSREGEYYYPEEGDFEEAPRPQGPLSRLPSARYARPAIICFILFYLVSLIYSRHPLGDKLWASGEAVFGQYEYWRLVTSLLTHADIIHLLTNALFFLVFGWLLRAYFGLLVFPVLSFIIGVATTLLAIALYEPHIRLIGASGMIYGMAALWLIFYVRYDTDHHLSMRIFRAVGFVMVMLLPTTLLPSVSYLAHALGFGIGFIAGLLLLPLVRVRDPGSHEQGG
jgi:rhomboid protease GluP